MTSEEVAEVVDYGKVLSHPLRLEILAVVSKAPASPVMISKTHGLGKLGVVSYHFNQLAELDCLTIYRTRPSRGTIEHIFKVTERGLRVLLVAEAIIDPALGQEDEPSDAAERREAADDAEED
jgi:hypothetical protein